MTANKSAAAAASRIKMIVDRVFAGSQRSMAKSIRISPATLSLVLSGQREPSPKLLHSIASLPSVNREWLLRGTGEPLNLQPQVLTDIGAIVPYAHGLLPGRPKDFEDRL